MGDFQRNEWIKRELEKAEREAKPYLLENTPAQWAWLAAVVVCGVVVWISLVKIGVAIVSALQ